MSNNAILFRTHLINAAVKSHYENLRVTCRENDVWFLLHHENQRLFKHKWIKKLFVFRSQQARELGYLFDNFWNSGHYPALIFYSQYPNYDYYWMIEYDVYYAGSWMNLFSQFGSEDFIAALVRSYEQDPIWIWWESVKPHIIDIPTHYWMKSFFPVVRFSNRALSVLHQYHRAGHLGYCEALVPTVLKHAGLLVADLNQANFGRNELYSRSTFWYEKQSAIPRKKRKGMLYHPVYGITKLGLIKTQKIIYWDVRTKVTNVLKILIPWYFKRR